jgi:hypothetical protein
LREGNDGPRSNFFMRTLTGAITALLMVAGLATPAIPQARTSEASTAELPLARSREGVRKTYIVSFGLFGPESVFASEAEKAAQILRARLQPDAQVLVRFNDKRGGSATSAALAASLRSTGRAMNSDKEILAVFLTSHGSPDGLAVVAGPSSELLSPRYISVHAEREWGKVPCRCPSSDNLRQVAGFRSGGSGSSGFEVRRPSRGAASGDWRSSVV